MNDAVNGAVNRAGTSLRLALQLLTRIPVNSAGEQAPQPADHGRSVLAYPLVGLLIGLGLAAVATALGATPALLQAALLLALWIGITGALHLDGIGDMADALIGGHGNRQRTLAILKDPHCGPMAVSAIVAVLLIKFAALAALLTLAPWYALLIAPLLGRAALVAAFLLIPYAQRDSLGSEHARHLPRRSAMLVLALSCGVAPLLLGWAGTAAVVGAGMLLIILRRVAIQRLGGLTGDLAGSICELTECVVLVSLVVMLANGVGSGIGLAP